jgi:hypothetical protein
MSQLETQVRSETPTRRGVPEVSGAWALGAGIAWVLGYQTMVWLEPTPTHPDALPGFLITAMTVVVNVGFVLIAVGLVRRARWAFTASAALALLVVGQVIACPVSGHHSMGVWWGFQAAIAAGLVVLSLAGWQAAGRSARAADQLTG